MPESVQRMESDERRDGIPPLILFTDAYPYGHGESFLESELPYLRDAFDRIWVVPRRAAGGAVRPLPSGVELRRPLFTGPRRRQALAGMVRGRGFAGLLGREFMAKRVYLSPARWIKWLEACTVVRSMHRHPDFPAIQSGRALLYFYWGVGWSWALPFLPPACASVVRFHGFDLYEGRKEYPGYLPLREAQLRALRLAVGISAAGLDDLRARYAHIAFPAALHRLGVADCGLAPWSPDNVFRIATCSMMVALKRLDLVIEALRRVDFPVQWTHIGDGPREESLKRQAESLPAHIHVQWVGRLPYNEVRRFYLENPQDIFLNVSTTEGAPVSVMEALNAGLPVVATDVGGTRELFDERAGWLLPADLDADRLANALRTAREAPDLAERRAAARRCWAERSNAAQNFAEFARRLKSILP